MLSQPSWFDAFFNLQIQDPSGNNLPKYAILQFATGTVVVDTTVNPPRLVYTAGGGGGGGITFWTTETTDFTAVKSNGYFVNFSSTGTITFPASAGSVDGDTFVLIDISGNAQGAPITITTDAVMIDPYDQKLSGSTNLTRNFVAVQFVWSATAGVWSILATNAPLCSAIESVSNGEKQVSANDTYLAGLTGNAQLDTPRNPHSGDQFTVRTYALAGHTLTISTAGDGNSVENPASAGSFGSTTTVPNSNQCITWRYDGFLTNNWFIIAKF